MILQVWFLWYDSLYFFFLSLYSPIDIWLTKKQAVKQHNWTYHLRKEKKNPWNWVLKLLRSNQIRQHVAEINGRCYYPERPYPTNKNLVGSIGQPTPLIPHCQEVLLYERIKETLFIGANVELKIHSPIKWYMMTMKMKKAIHLFKPRNHVDFTH